MKGLREHEEDRVSIYADEDGFLDRDTDLGTSIIKFVSIRINPNHISDETTGCLKKKYTNLIERNLESK